MATGAVAAELAAMHIVAAVTGRALAEFQCLLLKGCGVTRLAGQLQMGAIQNKRCLGGMVEEPESPVIWVVAIAAGQAHAAFVHIVLAMTVDTFC